MAGAEPRAINLLRGWPSRALLPTAQLQGAANWLFDKHPEQAQAALLYGPDQGFSPLRDAVSRWLSGFYQSPDDASRICITGGASQNLACILQVFADPGCTRNVWMVEPCYHLACRVFVDNGLEKHLRAVPEDDEGIDVEYFRRELRKADEAPWQATAIKPSRPWSKTYRHIIYAVPTFSNPSGKTMSLDRRKALVALAREHDALIVTDDVYDFLQWPTDAHAPHVSTRALIPRIVDIDRTMPPQPESQAFGNAVSNGSFSKIIGPGIRTGWAEGTPRFAHGLSQVGSSRSGGAPSQIAAAVVAEYVAAGALQRGILSQLIPAYAARYRTLVDAVKTHLVPLGIALTELGHEGVFGGYFIWLVLPESLRADEVTAEAAKRSLTIAPGSLFAVQGAESVVDLSGCFRLCFAWEDEDAMQEGVARLADIIKTMGREAASDN